MLRVGGPIVARTHAHKLHKIYYSRSPNKPFNNFTKIYYSTERLKCNGIHPDVFKDRYKDYISQAHPIYVGVFGDYFASEASLVATDAGTAF